MADGDQSPASSTTPTLSASHRHLITFNRREVIPWKRLQETKKRPLMPWSPSTPGFQGVGRVTTDRGSLGVGQAKEKLTGRGGGPQGEGESVQPGATRVKVSQQGWEVRVWNQAAENETSPGGTGVWCHSRGGAPTDCRLGAHSFQEQLPRSQLCQRPAENVPGGCHCTVLRAGATPG